MIDYLLHVNPSIDILLISEPWLDSTILDLLCFVPQVTLHCTLHCTVARGEGVTILYKKNLIISQYSPAISIDCAELIAVDVLLKKLNLQFRLICCYLSPRAAASAENVEKLCKVIDNCIAGSAPAYIVGDFNLPNWSIATTNSGPSHQTFLDFVTYTVKPLIERHPVFSKVAVSDLLTRIPLRLLSLLQRSIFSCFFFYSMLMLMLKEGFRVSLTAKRNRLRRLLEETGWP